VNPDDIRTVILGLLRDLAPEADPSSLDPGVDLRDELDLDSMDLLNLVVGIERELRVTVPERDYPQLRTVEDAVAYVQARRAAAP
jgi:acyl carrier protein